MFQRILMLGAILCSFASIDSTAQIADTFQYPLSGSWDVSRDFAPFVPAWCGNHLGQDVPRPALTTEVRAAANGVVRFSQDVGGLGHAIHIEHDLGGGRHVVTVYYHLKRMSEGGLPLPVGSQVARDDLLGHLTDKREDYSFTKPHLHFGIRNGTYQAGIDSRTGKWFYPGYTTIYANGKRQCASADPRHNQIAAEWIAPESFIESHSGGATCNVATPVVPCSVGPNTYDTFAGNYSGNRSFYRASSYDVSYPAGGVCLTIKPGLPHTDGYAYVANYGPTVWTSPAPYNVNFGVFGQFGTSCMHRSDHFEWFGVGSRPLPDIVGSFQGTVTAVAGTPPAGVNVGTGLSGHFTYPRTLTDREPQDPNHGRYDVFALGVGKFSVSTSWPPGVDETWCAPYLAITVDSEPQCFSCVSPYAFHVEAGADPFILDDLELYVTRGPLGLSPLGSDALPQRTAEFDLSRVGIIGGRIRQFAGTPQEYEIHFSVHPWAFNIGSIVLPERLPYVYGGQTYTSVIASLGTSNGYTGHLYCAEVVVARTSDSKSGSYFCGQDGQFNHLLQRSFDPAGNLVHENVIEDWGRISTSIGSAYGGFTNSTLITSVNIVDEVNPAIVRFPANWPGP